MTDRTNEITDEYSKPKYKNLIKYLHDRNHYLDVDAFTAENRVEILSNFILMDKKCKDTGKCFCSKVLKNVYWVDCILTNEPMMVGGGCKSLFTTRHKKKHKQQFLDRTLHLFRNNLGWERIIDWNDFIGQSIDTYLRNSSYAELLRLRELYKDNKNILERIDQYIGTEDYNTPTYENFLEDIENNVRMELYTPTEEGCANGWDYWEKYLEENYEDRLNILTVWESQNKKVYEFIQEVLEDVDYFKQLPEINRQRLKTINDKIHQAPKNYESFLEYKNGDDNDVANHWANLQYYDDCWEHYLLKEHYCYKRMCYTDILYKYGNNNPYFCFMWKKLESMNDIIKERKSLSGETTWIKFSHSRGTNNLD